MRKAANAALTQIGRPDAGDVNTLLEVLEDQGQPMEFRSAAAQVLGVLGPAAEGAVKRLGAALTDKQAGVRALVAYALADIGPKATAAIPALCVAARDAEPEVRAAAVFALGELGQFDRNAVLPTLEAAVKDADETVSRAAREARKKVLAAAK